MNLHVISVFYVSIFRKGKKVIRKETFLKKPFYLHLLIFLQYILIYYANIYKYVKLVMNGKNKHGLILS